MMLAEERDLTHTPSFTWAKTSTFLRLFKSSPTWDSLSWGKNQQNTFLTAVLSFLGVFRFGC